MATITGQVIFDKERNKQLDVATDVGVGNIAIVLQNTTSNDRLGVTTATSPVTSIGIFRFTNVPDGNYRLILVDGYTGNTQDYSADFSSIYVEQGAEIPKSKLPNYIVIQTDSRVDRINDLSAVSPTLIEVTVTGDVDNQNFYIGPTELNVVKSNVDVIASNNQVDDLNPEDIIDYEINTPAADPPQNLTPDNPDKYDNLYNLDNLDDSDNSDDDNNYNPTPSIVIPPLNSPNKISVSMTVNSNTTYVGDVLTYNIVIQNIGSVSVGTANNPVILSDYLPQSVSLIPQSIFINNMQIPYISLFQLNLGILTPSNTVTVSFSVEVHSARFGPIYNMAKIFYGYSPTGFMNSNTYLVNSNVVITYVY